MTFVELILIVVGLAVLAGVIALPVLLIRWLVRKRR